MVNFPDIFKDLQGNIIRANVFLLSDGNRKCGICPKDYVNDRAQVLFSGFLIGAHEASLLERSDGFVSVKDMRGLGKGEPMTLIYPTNFFGQLVI